MLYRQCNAHGVENSKLIGHSVITALSVLGSKFVAIEADVSNPVTPSYLRLSCLLLAVCVDYVVS